MSTQVIPFYLGISFPRLIELDEQDRLVENKQTESGWRGAICEEVADRIIYGIKHLRLPPRPISVVR